MMRFDVRGSALAITAHLNRHTKEFIPKAMVAAINNTAVFVEDKAVQDINRVFDRPTSWTKRAMVITRATPGRLYAEIKVKDKTQSGTAPAKYLDDHVFGESRGRKPFELLLIKYFVMPPTMYAVPAAGADMDAHGNMRPQQISAILSDLQARRDPKQNATAASRKRRARSKKKTPTFYFSTWSRGPSKRAKHLPAGIYKRVGSNHYVKPVLIFTRAPRYKQRWRFMETSDQIARMRFPIEFALAMRKQLAASYAR